LAERNPGVVVLSFQVVCAGADWIVEMRVDLVAFGETDGGHVAKD